MARLARSSAGNGKLLVRSLLGRVRETKRIWAVHFSERALTSS